MRYRSFGKLGWKVSEIGFGAWAIGGSWGPQDEAASLAALHRALDLGVNFIDTAQAYGDGRSERIIAQVRGERRDSPLWVATKIPPQSPGTWPPSPYDSIASRYPEQYLRQRVEQSLIALQTDCIDLLQLHTWTRAWNANPTALEVLRQLKQEGKIRGIGISTPEHDQDSLVQLMRDGWLDAVQVIYNIFSQEAQAEFFPTAAQTNTAVIVRCPFDESALTGKLSPQTRFAEGDFRNRYFAGDRLPRTVERVDKVKKAIGDNEPNLPTTALKFCLKPPAVSAVIPGMRSVQQAQENCQVSDLPRMSDELEMQLRPFNWLRAFWYAGK
jgi:aryl-alcohol dehydrogenase-like predicted oxidoreductase